MKPIYIVLILVLVCSLFFLLGFKLYKVSNNKFRDNVVPIVGLLRNELNEINVVLGQNDLPITWKRDLTERKQEVTEELNLFYGKTVF